MNNAGTEGQVGPITDQTAESYAATFDTNVLGVILSMKHEVRVMQGQGSGSIINISSTYGHEGAAGASVYVGSKHAVEGITKSVALEIAKSGIRVNGVAPGPTDTGMLTRFTSTPENKAALVTGVPMGRLGLSEELANAIVFIASDEASFITGQVTPPAEAANTRRERQQRRDHAHDQLLHHGAEHLERAAHHLPRLQSRLAVPVSRTLRPSCLDVPVGGRAPRRVRIESGHVIRRSNKEDDHAYSDRQNRSRYRRFARHGPR